MFDLEGISNLFLLEQHANTHNLQDNKYVIPGKKRIWVSLLLGILFDSAI